MVNFPAKPPRQGGELIKQDTDYDFDTECKGLGS